MYRAVFFSSEMTPAQVKSVTGALRGDAVTRGVPLAPLATPSGSPQLHAIGDSITAGYLDTTSWPANLSLANQPAYVINNWGIGGITALALAGSEPNRVAPLCSSASGPGVAILFEGTNDFMVGSPAQMSPTASYVFANIASEIKALKRGGCTVFVGTMLSRSGSINGGGSTYDQAKDALDALILQQAKSIGADGVVDFAAEPLIGADNASSNGTNFNPDGIHPRNVMQARMGAIASNSLNYYFGYNEVNPHGVTSLPYSMSAGDGEVSLAGLAGAGTVTLPDCTGQSGATYRIYNPQSAFAVTVTPLNGSQLINGLALAAQVTVPANGTLTLRDVPNAKAVSGCHWEM